MGFLDGKVALVTGGNRGIGRGVVEALAGEGAQVALTARKADAAAAAAREVGRGAHARRRGGGGDRPAALAGAGPLQPRRDASEPAAQEGLRGRSRGTRPSVNSAGAVQLRQAPGRFGPGRASGRPALDYSQE